MSRRKRIELPPIIIHGVGRIEYALMNYLNINNIYRGDIGMQRIIINSFFNQSGGNNNITWSAKLKVVHDKFGKFCQYAHNNWKHKTPPSIK